MKNWVGSCRRLKCDSIDRLARELGLGARHASCPMYQERTRASDQEAFSDARLSLPHDDGEESVAPKQGNVDVNTAVDRDCEYTPASVA